MLPSASAGEEGPQNLRA